MKTVNLLYSKRQIDKSGERLKINNISEKALRESLGVLSNWRAYHAMPLDTFAKVLKTRVKKISKSNNAIVAQRLKRTPSILLKLKTHKTMRLSAMQDIGGLRAIFDTVEEVLLLLKQYKFSKTKHTLAALDNYIDAPKPDGYRGVHLVYKLKKISDIFLEIQIRSHLQHIWATGVEVFGTLKNSSFKSGYGNKKWLEFFALLSSVFAIKEGARVLEKHKKLSKEKLLKRIKKMIKELRVIEQLNVYTALYKINSEKVPRGRRGSYALVLLNSKENTITVKTFSTSKIEEATQQYLELEEKYFEDKNINIVLVNSDDIKNLEISYPNYFMDTKTLVLNLSLILMEKFV